MAASPLVDTWLFSAVSPSELLASSPALFSAEAITYAAFAFALLHARRCSRRSKDDDHFMLLIVTLLGASIVDPVCLCWDQIRNYYHDRASILLFGKHVAPWQFPLFANLAYLGGASARRIFSAHHAHIERNAPFKSWWVPEACLTALFGSFTFYNFDMIACKYLVYQWHDHDPLYAHRTGECVPTASSAWVMAYGFVGSLLSRFAQQHFATTRGAKWWRCAAAATASFIPLHIAPISLIYVPFVALFDSGAGAVRLGIAICSMVVLVHFSSPSSSLSRKLPQPARSGKVDAALACALVAWFGGIAFHGAFIRPENVVSTCIHQPFGVGEGQCAETESYLFGLSQRKRYMCEDDFRFWNLVSPPAREGTDVYTISGKPASSAWLAEYFGVWSVGVLFHAYAFWYASSFFGKSKRNE